MKNKHRQNLDSVVPSSARVCYNSFHFLRRPTMAVAFDASSRICSLALLAAGRSLVITTVDDCAHPAPRRVRRGADVTWNNVGHGLIVLRSRARETSACLADSHCCVSPSAAPASATDDGEAEEMVLTDYVQGDNRQHQAGDMALCFLRRVTRCCG
jgi:hypothetical protein